MKKHVVVVLTRAQAEKVITALNICINRHDEGIDTLGLETYESKTMERARESIESAFNGTLRMCRTCGRLFSGAKHHHYCWEGCSNAHNIAVPESYRYKADRFNEAMEALITAAHSQR